MLGSNWGYCPDHLIPSPGECGENYEAVGGVCVRVSAHPLPWREAQEQCREEGGTLVEIMGQELQQGLQAVIRDKTLKLRHFSLAGIWSTGLPRENEFFWTGGSVSS